MSVTDFFGGSGFNRDDIVRPRRTLSAVTDYEPYEDEEDPGFPAFAPFSMMGTCPEHGFQRVTAEGVTGGSDPSQYFRFSCGCVDVERF